MKTNQEEQPEGEEEIQNENKLLKGWDNRRTDTRALLILYVWVGCCESTHTPTHQPFQLTKMDIFILEQRTLLSPTESTRAPIPWNLLYTIWFVFSGITIILYISHRTFKKPNIYFYCNCEKYPFSEKIHHSVNQQASPCGAPISSQGRHSHTHVA